MESVEVAVLETPGMPFAVVSVPDDVIEHQSRADLMAAKAVMALRCRVVLMGQRKQDKRGRAELLEILKYVNVARLPWRTMNWAAD